MMIGCAVVLLILLLLLSGRVGWQRKRMKVLGMLYGSTNSDLRWIALQIVRFCFILSIILFGISMQKIPYAIFYLLMTLIAPAFYYRSPMKVAFDLLNAGVIYVSLLVVNLLYGFSREVRDEKVLVIYVLLSIFVLLYTLFFICRDLLDMLGQRNAREGAGG